MELQIKFNMYRNILGDKNPRWKGGIRQRNGYIQIKHYTHPFRDKEDYVFQHRLIYENYLSILFDEEIFIPFPDLEIHHINGNRKDNRLINLDLVSRKIHRKQHMKDMSNRFCLLCNSNETYTDHEGLKYWNKYQDGFICNKCRCKNYQEKRRLR